MMNPPLSLSSDPATLTERQGLHRIRRRRWSLEERKQHGDASREPLESVRGPWTDRWPRDSQRALLQGLERGLRTECPVYRDADGNGFSDCYTNAGPAQR